LPSEPPARRLLDIVENGQAIAWYTEDMDARAVEYAVERCLERINEAAATTISAWRDRCTVRWEIARPVYLLH
jgi:uncharacterized protein with HEPN domain